MEVVKIKKFQLSILVILCTIVSVSFMMFDSFDNHQQLSDLSLEKSNERKVEYKEGNSGDINEKVEVEEQSMINGLLEENAELDMETDNRKKDKNNNQDDIDTNSSKTQENEDIGENQDAIKENLYEGQQDNNGVDLEAEEETSVFKMDAEKIVDELTLNQKRILLSVGMKLSPVDYAKMKEYLYMSDREEGISLALELAKKRLTNDEYQKMADTLDEYIDISAIEKKD